MTASRERGLPAPLGLQASCPGRASSPGACLKPGSSPLSTRPLCSPSAQTADRARSTPPPSRLGPARGLHAHLDALVARAGRHPSPVEVERDIMDKILMVRRDATRDKHGFRRPRLLRRPLLPPRRSPPAARRPQTAGTGPPGCAQRVLLALRPSPDPGPSCPARRRLRLLPESRDVPSARVFLAL